MAVNMYILDDLFIYIYTISFSLVIDLMKRLVIQLTFESDVILEKTKNSHTMVSFINKFLLL